MSQLYCHGIYILELIESIANSEMARDLLDLVVEGPEVDTIWLAFQDAEIDDEELEAQQLNANAVD